jgi:hypothetical protein
MSGDQKLLKLPLFLGAFGALRRLPFCTSMI